MTTLDTQFPNAVPSYRWANGRTEIRAKPFSGAWRAATDDEVVWLFAWFCS